MSPEKSPDAPKKKVPRQIKLRRPPFRVVFEDEHLLVADKDSGILTVPIPGKVSRNLQDLVSDYLMREKREALPVHRIDRYTSGLVVFAKNRRAREKLVEQFRAHTPERVYLALVRGVVGMEEGTLRHNLELTKDGFRQRVVRTGGTESVTHFKVLDRFIDATLLEVRLETGLKNQIRVQFRATGHPLVGDRHYAPGEERATKLGRQALHAWKLSFAHPVSRKPLAFEAAPPPDFERAVAKERGRKEPLPPPAPPVEKKKPTAASRKPAPPRSSSARSRGGATRSAPARKGRKRAARR